MKRFAAPLLLASALILVGTSPALAQSQGESPGESSQAPLRPFDPPEPEPVFIPDLVSDLVVTELGEGLAVSPLSANPAAATPGTELMDWAAWADFALPAALPLLMALTLLGLTRIPKRPLESTTVDGAT